MSQSSKKRMVFSLSSDIEKQLKAHVPARKRSELIEKLLKKHFRSMELQEGFEALERIRKRPLKKDASPLSAVELIRQDRQSH
jgi:hypothetical protein